MTDEIDDPRDDEEDDDIMDEESYDDFEDDDEFDDDWDDEDHLHDEDDEDDEDDNEDEEDKPSNLELHIAEKNAMSGTIPVAWCVSKEYLEDLKERGVKNPQLVICVAPTKNYVPSREVRYVVNLTDMLAYIEFKCSGENFIYGFIRESSHRLVKRDFLCRTKGVYDTTVFFDTDDYWHSGRTDGIKCEESLSVREFCNSDLIKVDVPKGVFAPEPPAWEKAWVNHFFRERPHDQCHFRRRRMFAYSVQPIIFLVFLMIRTTLLLGALLLGLRGAAVNWRNAFRLMSVDMPDAFESFFSKGLLLWNGEVELQAKGGHTDPTTRGVLLWLFKSGWKLVFTPAVLIAGCIIATQITTQSLLFAAEVVAGSFIVVVFLLWFLLNFIVVKSKFSSTFDKVVDFFNKMFPPKLDEDMSMLVCDGKKKPMSLSELPSKHRTFKLRFQELKSKVCRPFSN